MNRRIAMDPTFRRKQLQLRQKQKATVIPVQHVAVASWRH
jgi:hypothetical protein